MTIKEIRKGGASVHTVMSCIDGDTGIITIIPRAVLEYMDTMIAPPSHEKLLASIRRFGLQASVQALYQKQSLDAFMARSDEAKKRKVN